MTGHTHRMQLEEAEAVVAALRARSVFAHVYSGGVNRHGVRIALPDGSRQDAHELLEAAIAVLGSPGR